MKLITFAVPSYNSEAYLHNCIDSLLVGGDAVEIIIVNDGSTDKTQEIADAYQRKHPTIVKAVHKENGGHGSGVNRGLQEATGLFYKVVDSDDWLNPSALKTLLKTIKNHIKQGVDIDLYVNNFVYDKVSTNESYTRNYRKNFPNNINNWYDIKKFNGSSTMLMHALIYRTDMLRDSQTWLPEHSFYVDNIFAYKPLPYVKNISYLDIDLYHYFIGRSDQSVNLVNIVKRYKQQINVMKIIIDTYTYKEIKGMDKQLRKYMLHYVGAIMTLTMMFTVAKDSKERREDLKAFWHYVKKKDYHMYLFLRTRSLTSFVNYLPWKIRGMVMTAGYKYLRKRIKLG